MDMRKVTSKKSIENVQNLMRNDPISNAQKVDIQRDYSEDEITIQPLTLPILKKGNLTKYSTYLAFGCALLSGFAYAAIYMLTKKHENIDITQIFLYFSLGYLLFSLPIAAYENTSFKMSKVTFIFLTLRGIFMVSSNYFGFLAFRHLPLGEASVIIFSSPVMVTILARILFKEKCNRIDIVNLVLTFIGLALVVKVPQAILQPENRFSNDYMIGVPSAFGSLLSFTIIILITRKTKSVHYSVVNIITALISLPLGFIIINAYCGKFTNPCAQEYFPILFALLAFIGTMSIIRAIQLHNVGPVSTLRSGADIVFSFLWQVTYFGEIPDAQVVLGALLVMISIVLIGIKIWILNLPEDNVVRNRVAFLLK